MRHGFIKTAAVTPDIRVADTVFNSEQMIAGIKAAAAADAKLIVLPELCITGYTCGDLFSQNALLDAAAEGMRRVTEETAAIDALVFAGMPLICQGKLYNVAAVMSRGELLGFIPKTYLPNYGEFYEMRHFVSGESAPETVSWNGREVFFGTHLLFACAEMKELVVSGEICEDLWAPIPPSCYHTMAGASVIVNCSASDETIGKRKYRRELIKGQSARLICAYIYANAGEGESTTDLVFGGHSIIGENGCILAETETAANGTIFADIDIGRLLSERRRMTTFSFVDHKEYRKIEFHLQREETHLTRRFDPAPFVPSDTSIRSRRCEEILMIQALGLKKRLLHTKCCHAVVGISGGLDSTLALLVTVKAFDMLAIPRSGIEAVTMPCFGTSDRTYRNAVSLINTLGANFREVNIEQAVTLHFRDIGHDINKHDVTFENAQARERTQLLMDIANEVSGLVVGTGDMSELALGWATYNGDHMSMYGVNASVPKTLVRHLVRYYADTCGKEELQRVLLDVLDTPVSPELLPLRDGEIAQKTEEVVGPYELHDFFLYYMLRFGYPPDKILRIACLAFRDEYDEDEIIKWLRTFYRRFFSQQFKRSCLPDGPKVGTVALSPRGDLRMPSDACAAVWEKCLEDIR